MSLRSFSAILLGFIFSFCLANANEVKPPTPNWSQFEHFQSTITADEFEFLLQTVYAPLVDWTKWIQIHRHPIDSGQLDFAEIFEGSFESNQNFILRFADPISATALIEFRNTFPRNKFNTQKTRQTKKPQRHRTTNTKRKRPLDSIKIVLDPGHIGGPFAQLEERWFQINHDPPVTEGDLTLKTALILKTKLEKLGAIVFLTRNSSQPLTKSRPSDFKQIAEQSLIPAQPQQPQFAAATSIPDQQKEIERIANSLFIRREIKERADLVNHVLHPDFVVCLHFNAEEWGDPFNPALQDRNHLHVIINGNYLEDELEDPIQRSEMLLKLLDGSHIVEFNLGNKIADSLAKTTQLPPYIYTKTNAFPAGANSYLWLRNLLANRLCRCPVVYCEPFVMNSFETYQRLQLGEYKGTKVINGIPRKNIFQEYAEGVAEGIRKYYQR